VARAAAALGSALLALGIASALLLPNLFERAYIVQAQWVQPGYDYASHFVHPANLLSSAWGYAPGAPGSQGGMSFQLGAVPLILACVATVACFWRPTKERALILFFAGATLLIVLLMLPIAGPLWELIPIASLIQFPWRLLALTAVTLTVLSGLAIPDPLLSASAEVSPDSQRRRTFLSGPVLVLGLVAVLGSFAYTLPQYTPVPQSAEGPLLSLEFELKYPDMRGMTAWSQEIPASSPLVAQYQAGGPLVTAEVLAPDASLEMIRAAGASDEVRVRSPQGTALRFYTYYFPGWRVFIDGRRLPDSALRPETPNGLLTVDVPPGEHDVLLRWGDTPLRLAGKSLSVACLIVAVVLVGLSSLLGKSARH
jgi:hypothetical protein